jgi:crossover junction endodeoxyribonuclease RusA
MTYTLPVPPSTNRFWRICRGRPVLSSEARFYKKKVAALLHKEKPRKGEVSLTIAWYRERKSGDLSNRIKCLEDSLQGVLYVNDSQVVALHAYRYDDKANPRIEVSVQDA